MRYLKTSEIAKAVDVHPNTVRLYEEWGLLQTVHRNSKGYRLYTDEHLEQMRLARIALRCEFVAGNIREFAASIVKIAARGCLDQALSEAFKYLSHIKSERIKAEEALEIVRRWVNGSVIEDNSEFYIKRRDVAKLLNVSIDMLRNWERNGLIEVPRNPDNRYRVYGQREICRLKVIRTLRSANYSMMAILRLMKHIDLGEKEGALEYIDIVDDKEGIVYATDRWISVLKETEQNANEVITQLEKMACKTNQDF